MPKNILILYSDYTGYGHRSIVESLKEHFANDPEVNVLFLDGFSLGGNLGIRLSKLHSAITRNAREVWRMIWKLSSKSPSLICKLTERCIRRSFLEILKEARPDVILSVHPSFNGSVLNILEQQGHQIPFITLIADLVDVSPLWADPRADYILCPTRESRKRCIELNVPHRKAKVFGFPVRSGFRKAALEKEELSRHKGEKTLEFLIMSGGEGSGNMGRTAKILAENFDCHVTLVAGRNHGLKEKLEVQFGKKFGDRVKVLGFVNSIQQLMAASDLIFSRGSPNVIMEAVACNVPLVITGALPGQEAGNPDFVLRNNLGVVCLEPRKLQAAIQELLANNGRKIKSIKNAQRDFVNHEVAKNIAQFLLQTDKEQILKERDKHKAGNSTRIGEEIVIIE